MADSDIVAAQRLSVGQSAGAFIPEAPKMAQSVRLRNPALISGLLILILFLLMAVLSEWLAPYPHTEQHLADALQPPSSRYWLGADQFGRDILSRIIVGSRSILILTSAATALALVLGVTAGLTAGYLGGWWDEILMRGVDLLLSFPALLLALLIISSLGSDMIYLVLSIGIIFAPPIARVVRSVVLEVKTRTYVQAAEAIGATRWRIALRHILPNATGTIIVMGSIYFGYGILVGAGLGFLGLGVQPPSPDWGLQVNDGRAYILVAPWITLFPSLAISLLVVGVNLIADGLT